MDRVTEQLGAGSGATGMAHHRSRRNLVILGALSAFGPLSMDLYLPSTPSIAGDLNAGQTTVQLTLSGCIAGLAIGQLVAGPASDSFGRRRPLLIGLAVFVALSVACALAPNVGTLIAFRFLEGMGGAAGIVISRAIVQDLYPPREAARIFALLMLVSGLAPALAPVLGAQILRVVSWRGVFWVLAGIGIVLFVAGSRLPETLPPARRSALTRATLITSTSALYKDRRFVGNAIAVALSTAALFTYISTSPFIVEDYYGRSPQLFSALFAMNALGILISSQVSARLVRRRAPRALLFTGLGGQALAALAFLVLSFGGKPPLAVLVIPLFFVVASVGLIGPNGTALALSRHGGRAGAASAQLGAWQFAAGAVVSPLAGIGGHGSSRVPSLVIFLVAVTSLAACLGLTRRDANSTDGPDDVPDGAIQISLSEPS